ncbi:M48 family metalloprotease [Endozoicomonas sp. SM1973]|uniref:M48 family metalloprotease n=1 Tax=Spartinivicinus marinus TaxID=2994442 RepID=A0A853IAH8_9GAMM|nr:M48 family metallopeptidase [Spartinivicinus marinus]MCX4026074.1 M48 family metallopeptidase [Spartinivicinus marinus]NYZ66557.1 M48 family metalloprotease [Spartinivicinus marinus]
MSSKHVDHDFERTAAKAEALAASNISWYKTKLFLYALLGYGAIFAVLLILCGVVGGLVAMAFFSSALLLLLFKKKLFLVLIPTIWILLKALWVRISPPTGYELSRRQFPMLFKELDSLQKQLKAPKIHRVILTPELNAAICQTPLLGVFGWQRNTLILGMELLLTLSPKQAKAVVAHELGHLSGNHSRFHGWVYRVRSSWYQIMYAFQHQDSWGAKLMGRFFNWYAPRFAAYSFALARANEYEADQIAAQLTTPQITSSALINTFVTGPYVEEHYWQNYFKKADIMPEPDHLPWIGLKQFVQEHQQHPEELQKKLDEALAVTTSYDDTHPSLSDRIKSLKTEPTVPAPINKTAAEVWFGNQFKRVINEFDKDWLQHQQNNWQQRYQYVAESKVKLVELEQQATELLSNEALWQKACLTEEFADEQVAYSLFQAYQQRCPEDPDVAFVLGRMLFTKENESCLEHFKKSLENRRLVIDACKYAYAFLSRQERLKEAEWWREQAEQQMQYDENSYQERSYLHPSDSITPASVDKDLKSQLLEQLDNCSNIKKAWLAQKQVNHYPEVPVLILVIQFKGWNFSYEKLVEKIERDIEVPCSLFILAKSGDHKDLAKKIVKKADQVI